MRVVTRRNALLVAAACLAVAPAAWARPAPAGPHADGRLEVRIRSDLPLGFCDVVLERDGAVVRRGKPDAATGRITFERLAPGRYEVRAVSRSIVPRGGAPAGRPHRVAVWMRNGSASAGRELRERHRDKPQVVKLRMRWGRPVAEYLVGD
jgi:hypothetical protein